MAPGLFKSRRSTTASDETAKVVDAVWAYYEAGRRPATTQIAAPQIATPQIATPQSSRMAEPPAPLPVGEPELISHRTAHGPDESAVTAGGQSLSDLADELEALIESIRYADFATPGAAT
jgi:hypothetical protein